MNGGVLHPHQGSRVPPPVHVGDVEIREGDQRQYLVEPVQFDQEFANAACGGMAGGLLVPCEEEFEDLVWRAVGEEAIEFPRQLR